MVKISKKIVAQLLITFLFLNGSAISFGLFLYIPIKIIVYFEDMGVSFWILFPIYLVLLMGLITIGEWFPNFHFMRVAEMVYWNPRRKLRKWSGMVADRF